MAGHVVFVLTAAFFLASVSIWLLPARVSPSAWFAASKPEHLSEAQVDALTKKLEGVEERLARLDEENKQLQGVNERMDALAHSVGLNLSELATNGSAVLNLPKLGEGVQWPAVSVGARKLASSGEAKIGVIAQNLYNTRFPNTLSAHWNSLGSMQQNFWGSTVPVAMREAGTFMNQLVSTGKTFDLSKIGTAISVTGAVLGLIPVVGPVLGTFCVIANAMFGMFVSQDKPSLGEQLEPILTNFYNIIMDEVQAYTSEYVKRATLEAIDVSNQNSIFSVLDEMAWVPDMIDTAIGSSDEHQTVRSMYQMVLQHDLATLAPEIFGPCYYSDNAAGCQDWQDQVTFLPAMVFSTLHLLVLLDIGNIDSRYQPLVSDRMKQLASKYHDLLKRSLHRAIYKIHWNICDSLNGCWDDFCSEMDCFTYTYPLVNVPWPDFGNLEDKFLPQIAELNVGKCTSPHPGGFGTSGYIPNAASPACAEGDTFDIPSSGYAVCTPQCLPGFMPVVATEALAITDGTTITGGQDHWSDYSTCSNGQPIGVRELNSVSANNVDHFLCNNYGCKAWCTGGTCEIKASCATGVTVVPGSTITGGQDSWSDYSTCSYGQPVGVLELDRVSAAFVDHIWCDDNGCKVWCNGGTCTIKASCAAGVTVADGVTITGGQDGWSDYSTCSYGQPVGVRELDRVSATNYDHIWCDDNGCKVWCNVGTCTIKASCLSVGVQDPVQVTCSSGYPAPWECVATPAPTPVPTPPPTLPPGVTCTSEGGDPYGPWYGGCCSGLQWCKEPRSSSSPVWCDATDPNHRISCWSSVWACRSTCDASLCTPDGGDRYRPDLGGCCAGTKVCHEARPSTQSDYCSPWDPNHGTSCWSEIEVCWARLCTSELSFWIP